MRAKMRSLGGGRYEAEHMPGVVLYRLSEAQPVNMDCCERQRLLSVAMPPRIDLRCASCGVHWVGEACNVRRIEPT
jgi:hypothetical protein